MTDFVALFVNFPPLVATALFAMIPVVELRGAIPLAMATYDLPVAAVYVAAVVGSVVPAIPIIWLLGPISGYLINRYGWAKNFFTWLFDRTRNRFGNKYRTWGELALIIFVAIPLPVTGVWTGSVAAFLFGIPKVRALVLISIGSALAGLIVTALTGGVLIFF